MTKVFIIAEAGVNHNGDLTLAKQLIDEGVNAGVDAVKFQTFKAETLVSKNAQKADYQKNTTDWEESQFEMLKKLELDYEVYEELMTYAQERGVMFLSSAFDLESIELLIELGIELFKIPSGEITNLPYLRKIAQTGKKVVLSTGMSTLGDIEKALEVLQESGAADITVLHCNTEYPTPMKDVNLKAMNSIAEAFKVSIGYSDHTLGIEIPIAAVARGAIMIEKHFTLDKSMEGPDHKASLEPKELKAMVEAIRNIEVALGDGVKRLSESEKKNIVIARKSLVAKTSISEGDIFSDKNLTIKRPGTGLSPMEWDNIIGTVSRKSYKEDEVVIL
ncbi:MAG TPA: N-acetylneuraminate synthase [Candidatus Jeotgalibaca pullicola]|nr:N-acetylneuraminate synthase [Candidatus Jeotgalibaca pullicola]